MRFKLSALIFASAAMAASGCVYDAPKETAVGDYLSGRLAARTNDVNAAASAFASAQDEASGAGDILRDAFFFQLAAGNIDEAAPLAAKLAVMEGGDDGLARFVLAAQAIKTGRYKKARDYLSEGVEARYFSAATKILDAWALAGLEGPDAGYELLDEASGETFRGFNPLHKALLADKAGRAEEARAAYQLSVMTLGGPVGRSAYGAFLERAGDETAAREYYEVLAQNPGPARQTARQGLAHIAAGTASRAYADTTPAQGGAIAVYSLGAGMLEESANQRDAAIRAGFRVGTLNYNLPLIMTQLALYLDPDFDDALRFGGAILNVYGDHEGAIDMLSRIPSSSAYYEQAQIDIAAGLSALDRDDKAIAVLQSVARRDDKALEARWSLANLYAAEEHYKEAVKTLDELIARLPAAPDSDAWRFYVSRAAALMELDNWPRAEKDLQRAVEIAPEQPTALNYLGYSWAERGEHLKEAFDLIEKAVALQPDSGAIIDSLGWAHYQLGAYDDAVGHLEQAASIEAGDPTITDHLGDVYWRLGRKIEARYQWKRVLELEPNDKVRASVETKLANGLADTDDDANE